MKKQQEPKGKSTEERVKEEYNKLQLLLSETPIKHLSSYSINKNVTYLFPDKVKSKEELCRQVYDKKVSKIIYITTNGDCRTENVKVKESIISITYLNIKNFKEIINMCNHIDKNPGQIMIYSSISGRCGVFIAFHCVKNEFDLRKKPNVMKIVTYLKAQRRSCVSGLKQYCLVYQIGTYYIKSKSESKLNELKKI